MSFPPQSDPPFGRYERIYEITWHVPAARARGAPPSAAPGRLATQLSYRHAKFESNPFIGLACTLGYNFFARVCAIARGTCHVQPIGPKPLPSSFRRSGASNDYSPVPIRPAVRAPEAKMLGQTDRRTDTQTPAGQLFSSDPPEGISEHKGSMLTHWSLYTLRF